MRRRVQHWIIDRPMQSRSTGPAEIRGKESPVTRLFSTLLVALACAVAGPAIAEPRQELPEGNMPVLLVASPSLISPAYRRSVLLAVPTDGDKHIGFILNRPTTQSLSSLFPEHEPSKKVVDPVFFGGPMSLGAVFALVRADHNPGGGSIPMLDNLYFAMRVDVVDRIIESTPNDARYYVGMVQWRPGELRQELERGLWYVLDADVDTVFRKHPERLWEELTQRANTITAEAIPATAIRLRPAMPIASSLAALVPARFVPATR
jgi:putative transcriptional regulator